MTLPPRVRNEVQRILDTEARRLLAEDAAVLNDATCSISGCEGKHHGRGWCSKHYQRWQRHGDPQVSGRHGHTSRLGSSPTYYSWQAMTQRCTNPNSKSWADYGGKGISICSRWTSFEAFLGDMGERPEGTSLDRIDGAGNYEPGNCRWATPHEQRVNQSRRERAHGTRSKYQAGCRCKDCIAAQRAYDSEYKSRRHLNTDTHGGEPTS